jgi:UDP-N-acetylmuramate dehydrogenase
MMTMSPLADALLARLPGRVTADASIAELTTYRLGGPIAALARVGTEAELHAVAEVVDELTPPVLVVGRGSNLLVADEGFPGLGIVLDGAFDHVEIAGSTATAGGAVALPVLARRTAAAGRAGLEFLVGIPGSVGGAVRMNAGGHGRETREVLVRAWIADLTTGGTPVDRSGSDLDLSYRHSDLGDTDVVVRAEFAVQTDEPSRCEDRIADVVRWRREHQPGGANAGSVFRNPPGDSAGRLVDACGLKGLRVGGASVSDKHANFIQADPGALAADVRDLVFEVRRRVEAETGVRLVPELRLVGFAAPVDDGDAPIGTDAP